MTRNKTEILWRKHLHQEKRSALTLTYKLVPENYTVVQQYKLYTVGHKKRAPKLLSITLAIINRFR